MTNAPSETRPSAAEEFALRYRYGWRYVERELPTGGITWEQVPLTLEDVLHPQEGDQVTHAVLHQRICVYLYAVFQALVAAIEGAVVLHDVRVDWGAPDVKPHGPDLAVLFGVREPKNWSTFYVAEEGAQPVLVVEVTSPETRSTDIVNKLDEYDLAGVPLYVIVDLVERRGQSTPRLFGYRQTEAAYTALAADARGWLWLEPLRCWLGVDGENVVCYDESGQPIGDYLTLRAERDEAQARAAGEAQARAAAEERVRALEEELRRLRGQQ
jgi:Uma2 family endonuclease